MTNEPILLCSIVLRAWFVRHRLNPERTKTFVFKFVFVSVLAHEQPINKVTRVSDNRPPPNDESPNPNPDPESERYLSGLIPPFETFATDAMSPGMAKQHLTTQFLDFTWTRRFAWGAMIRTSISYYNFFVSAWLEGFLEG